jgi:hypothetical protein
MDSFKSYVELNEIFDSTLPLTRHKSLENDIKSKYYPHTLTNVEAYHTEHKKNPYVFIRFKHKGAWEVRCSRADENSTTGLEPLNKHKGADASHLVGTAIKLYKEKLDRDQPIRYVGDNQNLNRLYDSTFKHISKKDYNGKLHSLKINDFKDHNGETKEATEIHTHDIGSPSIDARIKNENYVSPYTQLN